MPTKDKHCSSLSQKASEIIVTPTNPGFLILIEHPSCILPTAINTTRFFEMPEVVFQIILSHSCRAPCRHRIFVAVLTCYDSCHILLLIAATFHQPPLLSSAEFALEWLVFLFLFHFFWLWQSPSVSFSHSPACW
jgi:hypothetical protein